MKWFYVMDMHSGGGRKTAFEMYFIEAADECDARARFSDETGEDPDDVCCDCCGENFSVNGEYDTLAEAAEYWALGRGSVEEYLNDKRNLVKVMPLTDEDILI
jgi:hypothetical protein